MTLGPASFHACVRTNVARPATAWSLASAQVAERAGVDPAFLAPGGQRLGIRRTKALARVLGVDPLGIVSDPSRPASEPVAVITANVARLATEMGLTVEEVAKRAGLKPSALSASTFHFPQ